MKRSSKVLFLGFNCSETLLSASANLIQECVCYQCYQRGGMKAFPYRKDSCVELISRIGNQLFLVYLVKGNYTSIPNQEELSI